MKKDHKHLELKSLKFDEWLYLIHHIHHYIDKKKRISHELHHCFLFSEKNLKGKKFKVKHLLIKNKLYHVLEKEFSGILYDHANNSYKIVYKKIGKDKYSLIGLNKKLN